MSSRKYLLCHKVYIIKHGEACDVGSNSVGNYSPFIHEFFHNISTVL